MPRFLPPLFVRLLCLFVAIGSGCSKRDQNPASPSQILRLSQRNEPADLDPAIATLPDEFAILRALSEGLLIPGPAGTDPQPGAAERYDVSPDGLTYTFHLRRNARWSNGDPLTAAHFVESYRRLLTPATAAPKAGVFFPVKNARAFVTGALADFSVVGIHSPDTHTLVITLEQPNPRFPHYVASGPWLPIHPPTLAQHGRKWTAPENFTGNGPFTLAEWRPHQRIVVKKNPRWHGAAGVRLAEIHFIHFDNADAEERAYRGGQIDATMAVPTSKLETYARERPAELRRAPLIETRYLSFNTRRPPLDDPRFRRALAFAIDRQKIVDRVLRGGQPPAGRLLPPPLHPANASRENAPDHRHLPQVAREILQGIPASPEKSRRLELTAWSPSQIPVLETIQAMWRETLGLEVGITIRDAKVHLAALASGDYDIAFITAIPDVADPANLLGDLITGAPENYPQWSDASFDSHFSNLGKIADPARRDATFIDLEARILAAAPLTPLYYNTKIWLMSSRVRGWQEDGLWTRCYQTIHLDEK